MHNKHKFNEFAIQTRSLIEFPSQETPAPNNQNSSRGGGNAEDRDVGAKIYYNFKTATVGPMKSTVDKWREEEEEGEEASY